MATNPPKIWDVDSAYAAYPGRNWNGNNINDVGGGRVSLREVLWWGMTQGADLLTAAADNRAYLKRMPTGSGFFRPRGRDDGPGRAGDGRSLDKGMVDVIQATTAASDAGCRAVADQQSTSQWSFYSSGQCTVGRFYPDSAWNLYVRAAYTPPVPLPRTLYYVPPAQLASSLSYADWFNQAVVIFRFPSSGTYATYQTVSVFDASSTNSNYAEPFRVAYVRNVTLPGGQVVAAFNLFPGVSYDRGRGRFMHHSIRDDLFTFENSSIDSNNNLALFFFSPIQDEFYLRSLQPDGTPGYVALDEHRGLIGCKAPAPSESNRDRLYPQVKMVEANAYATKIIDLFSPDKAKADAAKMGCCVDEKADPLIVQACTAAGVKPGTTGCLVAIKDHCAVGDNIITDDRCRRGLKMFEADTDDYMTHRICDKISAEQKAQEPVEGQINYGNVCACFRGAAFYKKYGESIAAAVGGRGMGGIDASIIASEPESFFIKCAAEQDYITERKKQGKLRNLTFQTCVQTTNINIDGTVSADDVKIDTDQKCQIDYEHHGDGPGPGPGPEPGIPIITRVSPASGPVGTTVTVTGTNLARASQVLLGKDTVAFTQQGSGVTFKIPEGAQSGIIRVSTAGGDADSDAKFVVTQGPVPPGPTPPPPPPKKSSLTWLWWTLGGVALVGLIILIIALARRGK